MYKIKLKLKKVCFVLICFCFIQCKESNQSKVEIKRADSEELIQLNSKDDLKDLAEKIIENASETSEKAKRIIDWTNSYLEWNESDYVERTVVEIINQKGGTCGEQSITVRTLFDLVGIKNRECAEINIQPKNTQRELDAKEVMEKFGLRMSVFGLHHNDHRWVEFYDEKQNDWIPTDPTLRLFGLDNWLKARIGFNDRPVNEMINSKDMIVPIVIIAVDNHQNIIENRSRYYLIDQFNNVYRKQLQNMNYWQKWTEIILDISAKCEHAFKGELNLHNYNNEIEEIQQVYDQLRNEYLLKK